MAINTRSENTITGPVKVIGKKDDAIDMQTSDWDAYKESLDDKHLRFLPGKSPTLFICNFKYDAKAARMVNNAMLAAKDDSGNPTMSYGAWSQTIAKVSLKDVTNPDGVPADEQVIFRKDANGYVHDELLAKLERWGVVDDIFNAYIQTQKSTKDATTTKNS